MSNLSSLFQLIRNAFAVFVDVLTFFRLTFRSPSALVAENLFLRKQLGLYIERKKKPRRATNSVRFALAHLARFFDWRDALTVVKPDTLIRWHRQGFRLFWKWKSRASGRPRVPVDVRRLIVEMATNNPTWGEERIANELSLEIGIRISPRTVRQYMPEDPKRPTVPSQRWMTFVRNHAKAIIACDFFVVMTATFRLVYVLVILEIGTRRILHVNVTRHPPAEWTLQQFRESVIGDEGYKFIIHDRDSIYSSELDSSLRALGLRVLRTPYRCPQANVFCERLIGSARRECLDFMIPFNEAHVRQTLKPWIVHYNRGRPHSSLGPGMPDASSPKAECRSKRHEISEGLLRCFDLDPRRSSSRVSLGANCCVRLSAHKKQSECLFAEDSPQPPPHVRTTDPRVSNSYPHCLPSIRVGRR